MRRKRFLILALLVALADLLSKSLVFRWYEGRVRFPGEIAWVCGRWLGVARVMNPGVTGGLGSGVSPWILTAFTFLAVGGIALYLLVPKEQGRWIATALALILGGAAGNLYDRIAFGEVRDFIDVWPRVLRGTWLFHWPTFNLADSAIVAGVLMLVFHSLFLARDEKAGAAERT